MSRGLLCVCLGGSCQQVANSLSPTAALLGSLEVYEERNSNVPVPKTMSFLGVLIPESDRHLGAHNLHLHRSRHPLLTH